MKLSSAIAQRIVDRVATGLDMQLSVADATARIVASTTAELVGTWHAPAARAIATGAAVEDADGFIGIGLPLCYAGQVVGALMLNGAAQHRRELAQVSRSLTELIIHQATVIEQLPRQAWPRDKFIADLLYERLGGAPEPLLQEAELLAIDLGVPRVVVAIEAEAREVGEQDRAVGQAGLPQPERRRRSEQVCELLAQRARETIATHPADIYSALDERRLIVLAAIDPLAPEARRQQLARELQGLLSQLAGQGGPGACAGIGRYYPGWRDLARSFADARFALETGTRLHGPGQVFRAEELGLAGFICSDDRALKVSLARHLLRPIAADRELLDTLAAFLDANLSPSPAAQALHIHRHTLAYRLDKIAALTHLNPREFEAAAQLRAALLLAKLDSASA
jgi:carbohydrate diacid regulator